MGGHAGKSAEGLRQQRAGQLRAEMEAKAEPGMAHAPSDAAAHSASDAQGRGAGPVGAGRHRVSQGECISSIAKDKGHFWQTLWNDPANADLRAIRKDQNVLLPGDRVHVPALRKKYDAGQSEMRHRFVRRGWPEMLRIRVLRDGEPRGNEPYTVEIDGAAFSGTTDADGKLSCPIAPNARRATLRVGVEPEASEYRFTLGAIDPIEEISGVQGRLNNLGFNCGAIDGVYGERTEALLREYQRSRGLPITGFADEGTRRKLQADFGC